MVGHQVLVLVILVRAQVPQQSINFNPSPAAHDILYLNMDSETIENRIAILIYLPDDLSSGIRKIQEEAGISYPNHETKVPHITIYSCKFDESKFPELVQKIKDLSLRSFSLKLGDVTLDTLNKGSVNSFASIKFQDESLLHELHENILLVANELRVDLVRAKDIERFNKGIYSPELFSFIQKYGYEHVKENFHPHITLGEIMADKVENIEQVRELSRPYIGKEFKVESVCLVLSTRLIPSEEKVKDSESVEIKLES